jgi:hypothetical protein
VNAAQEIAAGYETSGRALELGTGHLGARIQHALRAFTPEDQKALSQTVKTYTPHYALDLGVGEAIVTVLSERGAPPRSPGVADFGTG